MTTHGRSAGRPRPATVPRAGGQHPTDAAILAPVQPLPLDEVDRRWVEIEAAVDATTGIDPWCSGPDWQLPCHRAFAPTADPLILASDHGAGFALLARYRADRQTTISGLEPLWGFGCPIIGPDPGTLAAELAAHLAADHHWDNIVLPGLPPNLDGSTGNGGTGNGHPTAGDAARNVPTPADPAPNPAAPNPAAPTIDPMTMAVASPLTGLGQVGLAEGITRQVADLTGDHDAWLAGRSPRFRRNLRKARQAADRAGLHIIDSTDDPDLFDRLLVIEHRSWKGREGSGITGPEMATMYRAVVERLARRDRLVAHIAVLHGSDVGYIVGGIRASRYRGLQLSYTTDAADLSIGNLLQAHQLAQLNRLAADRTGGHEAEGDHPADLDRTAGRRVNVYDLGMDISYKRRWADRSEPSTVLVVRR